MPPAWNRSQSQENRKQIQSEQSAMWSDFNPNFISTHSLHRTQTHKPPSTQKTIINFWLSMQSIQTHYPTKSHNQKDKTETLLIEIRDEDRIGGSGVRRLPRHVREWKRGSYWNQGTESSVEVAAKSETCQRKKTNGKSAAPATRRSPRTLLPLAATRHSPPLKWKQRFWFCNRILNWTLGVLSREEKGILGQLWRVLVGRRRGKEDDLCLNIIQNYHSLLYNNVD